MSNTQLSITIDEVNIKICFSQNDTENVKNSIIQILTGAYEEKIENLINSISV